MILVDRARWRGRDGVQFAHLVSDASFDELHDFVAALPMTRPLRFHRDHYDVPSASWRAVVDAGAQPVSTHEIVRRLRAAGLRATSAGSGRHRRGG